MRDRTYRGLRLTAGMLALLALTPAPRAHAQEAMRTSADFVEDFDTLWTAVRDHYAYFSIKSTNWDRVRVLYRPRAFEAQTVREFVVLLERVLDELYDPHTHLLTSTSSSPRLIPSDADVWGGWNADRAMVVEVRRESAAERAGIRAGDQILSINQQPVEAAVRARFPLSVSTGSEDARNWALTASLAGQRDGPVSVVLHRGNAEMRVQFTPQVERPSEPLTVRVQAENVGYVKVNNSLGDPDLIAAWDSALVVLQKSQGLILDLRDTPSGGNTTVARALMSRLIKKEEPYQRHELVSERRATGVRRLWTEYVAPRGPFTYEKPVVVLVGRWTGSMGEGVAIGLHGMNRATPIGTVMARLLGATSTIELPRTGIRLNLPTEQLSHIDGTPREAFVPPIEARPGLGKGDPTLERAVLLIDRRRRGHSSHDGSSGSPADDMAAIARQWPLRADSSR